MSQFKPFVYKNQIVKLLSHNNKIMSRNEIMDLLGYSRYYLTMCDMWAFKMGFIIKISYGKYKIDMNEIFEEINKIKNNPDLIPKQINNQIGESKNE